MGAMKIRGLPHPALSLLFLDWRRNATTTSRRLELYERAPERGPHRSIAAKGGAVEKPAGGDWSPIRASRGCGSGTRWAFPCVTGVRCGGRLLATRYSRPRRSSRSSRRWPGSCRSLPSSSFRTAGCRDAAEAWGPRAKVTAIPRCAPRPGRVRADGALASSHAQFDPALPRSQAATNSLPSKEAAMPSRAALKSFPVRRSSLHAAKPCLDVRIRAGSRSWFMSPSPTIEPARSSAMVMLLPVTRPALRLTVRQDKRPMLLPATLLLTS